MIPLAQPPRKDDRSFDDWMYRMWRRIAGVASIAWSVIDKTGSNLTDIQTRNHADLQNLNTASYTHLTSTQATDLTDGGDTILHKHDRYFSNHGVDDRTGSTLSFVNATRTCTITPTGASFLFWINGTPFTKTTAQSVVITDTEGQWYIYFDTSGNLAATQTFTTALFVTYAWIASVYWDATNKIQLWLGDERHGPSINPQLHLYLHDTRHTVYDNGLALSGIIADGNGSLNTQVQFAVGNGVIWDEDINLTITGGSPQVLSPTANLPLYYRSGAAGVWRKVAASAFPLAYGIVGTGRGNWNEYTGATWQLTEITNGDYFLMHYFATHDILEPVKGVVGQARYTTLANAQAGAQVEIASIVTAGIQLAVESLPIATVIFQSSNSYSNTPKSRIRSTASGASYIDWRSTTVVTIGASGTTWGNISGVLSNQTDLQTVLDSKAPLLPGEPQGFPDRTQVSLSWVDATRTLTVTPTGASFSFYSKSVYFTHSAPDSITIPNVTGNYFIYYDNTGTIQYSATFSIDLIITNCFIVSLYWNATSGGVVPDALVETHGCDMMAYTHLYLHNSRGAAYHLDGGLACTVIADGDGSNLNQIEVTTTSGYIWDEDIQHAISSHTAATNIPVMYRTGASGVWSYDATSPAIVRSTGTGRAAWNEYTGGTWQLTEITNGDYILAHLFAIPGITVKWMVVMGTTRYTTLSTARAGAESEILGITGIPLAEFKAIASFVVQSSSAYTNAVKSRIRSIDVGVDFIDWRYTQIGGMGISGIAGSTSTSLDIIRAVATLRI